MLPSYDQADVRWQIWLAVVVAGVITACNGTTAPPAVTTPAQGTSSTHAEGVTTAPGTGSVSIAEDDEEFRQAREAMVESQIVARGVRDPIVLEAMRTVARHQFVPPRHHGRAYADHPLPIGFGQTISQPYIVAWMSELLEVEPGARVLEVGTGSGYQAAVLAEMGVEVYTVEIIPELAAEAAARLDVLGFDSVHTLHADGYFGWEEHSPYDAIVVTAAPDHVPQPLLDQLVTGGHMVIPVGPVGSFQTMWRFTLDESGEPVAENLGFVAFVPLTRDED